MDLGARRVGLAVSDPTGTLARPLTTLEVTPATTLARLLDQIDRLAAEADGLALVVVGVPRHLDGIASPATARAEAVIAALRARLSIPVVGEDERLTSREAESRLAEQEPDWRKRKRRLDAAAAAIILQDYLDRRVGERSWVP